METNFTTLKKEADKLKLLHDVIGEYFLATDNFPGNMYWSGRIERAFNGEPETYLCQHCGVPAIEDGICTRCHEEA